MAPPEEVLSRERTVSGWRRSIVSGERLAKISLIGGFLATISAVFIANQSSPEGYEVSIYTGTPTAFWALLLIALLVAVAIVVYSPGTELGRLGFLLAGASGVTVFALPLLRGYHYYGLADGMNHLGYARKLATGARYYLDTLYPGGHSSAVMLDKIAGIGLPRAMLFIVLACTVAFILFIPLIVREWLPGTGAVALAVFAALLLLPINNVATTNRFHPFTLTILLTPIFFYLLFKHVRFGAEDETLPSPLTAAGLLLPIVGFGLVLYHPQAMFDVLGILVVVGSLQVVARVRRSDSVFGHGRGVYGQAVILTGLFYLWTSRHWETSATFERTKTALLNYLQGSGEVAPGVSSRTNSADSVGVSFVELFLKLFSVELLAGIAAAALVLAVCFGLTRLGERVNTAVVYLVVGVAGLTPYFLTQILGNISHNFFRHFGFLMVIVTMLAPVAVYAAWVRLDSHKYVRPALTVVVVCAIVLSAVAIFPSPYIVLENHHASDQHMSGFEETYTHTPDIEPHPPFISGVQGTVLARYKTALASKPGTVWYPGIVKPFPRNSFTLPSGEIRNLQQYFRTHPEQVVRTDHYFIVTAVDLERELVAKDQLRYTPADFAAIQSQPDVHRWRTNGQSRTYYVDLPPAAGQTYQGGGDGQTTEPGTQKSS